VLISLPIDIDAVALRLAQGIDADQLPAGLKAITVDDQIFLDRSLLRWEQRYYGGHEIYHAASDDDLFPWLDGDPRLAIVEGRASAFRDELLMPFVKVVEGIMDGWTAEEFILEFGLPSTIVAGRILIVKRELGQLWWSVA